MNMLKIILLVFGATIVQCSTECRTPKYCDCMANPEKAKTDFEGYQNAYYKRVDDFLAATIPLVEGELNLNRRAIDACNLSTNPKDYIYTLVSIVGGDVIPRDTYVPFWKTPGTAYTGSDVCLWILQQAPKFCAQSQRNWVLMDDNAHMSHFDMFRDVFKVCAGQNCNRN